MNRQINNDDFEIFLRESANQHRMYPSEKVWNGVHGSLHTHRKWYAFTALGMLLLLGSFTSLLYFNTSSKPKQIAASAVSLISNKLDAKYFIADIKKNPTVNPTHAEKQLQFLAANSDNDNLETVQAISIIEEINNEITLDETTTTIENATLTYTDDEILVDNLLADAIATMRFNILNDLSEFENNQEELFAITETSPIAMPIPVDASSYTIPKKQARLNTHIYIIPTVSYRKLSENKNSSAAYQGFGYQQSTNVKNVVNHKPDLGFEFGIGGRYRMNDNFYITSGLQFNITRYNIRAYYHPTEIATVALNSGYRTDSMASLSNYRNFNGVAEKWLENFYFQVALPIGAEIILAKNKKINWGISGSLQPTYVIGDRAYLISSDYKNYAKFPNLMRRWNLSTSIGTFVTYSTGKINWQLGPMVRYQQLSSFNSKYPVRENLFDVGFKVGATFNKK